jgi:DNA-binding CsgD family transcriptional regulator
MTAAQSVVNTITLPNSMLGYQGERTIAHFERELAMHKVEEARLRCALARAEALLDERRPAMPRREEVPDRVTNLTPRQHEIMALVLAGHPSKNIAVDLGISQRTVENHRAAIMKKTGSNSLPALGRFGFAISRPLAQERSDNVFAIAGVASPF